MEENKQTTFTQFKLKRTITGIMCIAFFFFSIWEAIQNGFTSEFWILALFCISSSMELENIALEQRLEYVENKLRLGAWK